MGTCSIRNSIGQTKEKYDALGEQEWLRFEKRGALGELDYMMNLHFLKKYSPLTGIALDAGSGPCRFSIELAKSGLTVLALDLSENQLEIGQQMVRQALVTNRIHLVQGSIHNLNMLKPCAFDFVTCIGGALSHMLEECELALSELVQVLKRGQYIVLSVMSRNCNIDDLSRALWTESSRQLKRGLHRLADAQRNRTAYYESIGHFRKFSSEELVDLLEEAHLEIVELAAADRYPLHLQFPLENIRKHVECWNELINYETQICTLPWVVNSGNMIIAVAKKLH